jgi:hypothetical protein
MARIGTGQVALGGVLAISAPAVAQQAKPQAPAGQVVFDLEQARQEAGRDPLLKRRCEDEADAAQIAGEIVVCRSLGEASDGSFDKGEWERRYAERTRGIDNPNVDGTGLKLPTEGSVATVTVTIKPGKAKPPPLIIDVEALPEAPPGSDADRVGQGLRPE